jgi:pectate lyase
VLADNGDAIGIQASSHVWIDHVDVSSDRSHDKDYYDGLIDVTHGSDWVTISNSHLHDHWKASLVGHSDSNGGEDSGHLTVTYAGNWWSNINSRMPSYRFGTGHVYNSYFENSSDGINTRLGAQLLVQNCVFESVKKSVYSTDQGYANVQDCVYSSSGGNDALGGSLSSVPYCYELMDTGSVRSSVSSSAGQTLSF